MFRRLDAKSLSERKFRKKKSPCATHNARAFLFVGKGIRAYSKPADDLIALIKKKALMTAQSSGLNFSPHAAGLMLFWGFLRRADDVYTPKAGKRIEKDRPAKGDKKAGRFILPQEQMIR